MAVRPRTREHKVIKSKGSPRGNSASLRCSLECVVLLHRDLGVFGNITEPGLERAESRRTDLRYQPRSKFFEDQQ